MNRRFLLFNFELSNNSNFRFILILSFYLKIYLFYLFIYFMHSFYCRFSFEYFFFFCYCSQSLGGNQNEFQLKHVFTNNYNQLKNKIKQKF